MDRATATRAYAGVLGRAALPPPLLTPAVPHMPKPCARIGMINFPWHVDFGAGLATTLAICAIIVHRIVSTEDPRAVDYISLSV